MTRCVTSTTRSRTTARSRTRRRSRRCGGGFARAGGRRGWGGVEGGGPRGVEGIEGGAPAVAAVLAAAGMTQELRTPLMSCGPHALVDAAADVSELAVAPVGDGDLRDCARVQRAAFGEPPLPADEPPPDPRRRGGGAGLAPGARPPAAPPPRAAGVGGTSGGGGAPAPAGGA